MSLQGALPPRPKTPLRIQPINDTKLETNQPTIMPNAHTCVSG